MQVLGLADIEAYATQMESDREEAVFLFRDLLIGVTTFFRDEKAFESVKQVVIPRLFEGKGAGDTVRVWVPGCATGEEAYSLAILLREHMDSLSNVPKVQVFATDIDEPAIGTARAGRYPSTLLDGLSPERRARFFTRHESSYTVSKDLRGLCTFSAHSLVRDPPFSRMNLVSCRNLLIYMDVDLQAAVIPALRLDTWRGTAARQRRDGFAT
jgi:two-component system CheB/CheR fusion protein